jgi:hypothetical protein
MEETVGPSTPPQEFRRTADYSSKYTNNVQFEPSVWGLKTLFGELALLDGKLIVEQHTAISMPWIQAKIMGYFLQFQIAVFEHDHGKIAIPDGVIPGPLPPIPDEMKDDPRMKAIWDTLEELRQETFLR